MNYTHIKEGFLQFTKMEMQLPGHYVVDDAILHPLEGAHPRVQNEQAEHQPSSLVHFRLQRIAITPLVAVYHPHIILCAHYLLQLFLFRHPRVSSWKYTRTLLSIKRRITKPIPSNASRLKIAR